MIMFWCFCLLDTARDNIKIVLLLFILKERLKSSQILAEYRARVRSFHPDITGDSNSGDMFSRLTHAKDVLCDESQRRLYDSWLDSGLLVPWNEWRDSQYLRGLQHWHHFQGERALTNADNDRGQSANTSHLRWERQAENSDIVRKFRNYEI
ncbi:hypothetical protein AB6A40_010625 [Gnathostoma spinigerum]|uniref:J domain-containing protein n=1 Tax=Gnathostoma spinigerum TaxID=75299 RepID=A0ABD6EVJ9_9BILA